jgi:hypothetical protein
VVGKFEAPETAERSAPALDSHFVIKLCGNHDILCGISHPWLGELAKMNSPAGAALVPEK